MRESLIFATLNKESIIFEKESFINAKKILNSVQKLTNGKKVIKSLPVFHIHSSADKNQIQNYMKNAKHIQ